MLTAEGVTGPLLLTIGDPLIALLPSGPEELGVCSELRLYTGGAELNTAVGVRRLGVSSAWLGRVGDDPFGRRVIGTLRRERVFTDFVVVDRGAATGLYLREWLSDGLRRPYYYRSGGAGTRLESSDWPDNWPAEMAGPAVVHVTGITSALSAGAATALRSMIENGRRMGAVISVDPNFRPALWPQADRGRELLRALVEQADLVLLSEDDAELLTGGTDPERVAAGLPGAHQAVVYKRGAAGVTAWSGGRRIDVPAYPAVRPIDPVGAGDGFNAGFLAAWLRGASVIQALQCGAWCGARAVEVIGEHDGCPRTDELPKQFRRLFCIPAQLDEAPNPAAHGGGVDPKVSR